MLLDLLLIGVGLVGLFFGADWLVKGAARLAGSFGIPPLVIGLTVVAYGTSMPEQIVSLTAALNDASDIAVGNVVGSNIFNIALILGITSLIFPIAVNSQLIKREIPLMIVVSFIAFFLASTGKEYSRIEGVVLFAGVLAFTVFSLWFSQRDTDPIEGEINEDVQSLLTEKTNRLLEAGRALVGVIILVLAATATIEGATGVAKAIGISDVVIGLTLVAAGTSLPELATSVVAAFRKQADISVGNIVGSNLFNLLSILGITAIVSPISVNSEILRYDFWVMIGVAIMLFPLALNRRLDRYEGVMFLAVYVSYTIFLFVR